VMGRSVAAARNLRQGVPPERMNQMKAAEATAEVFVTAFEALGKEEREAILRRLFEKPKLREDLMDVSCWLARRKEKAIPYEKVRRNLQKSGRL